MKYPKGFKSLANFPKAIVYRQYKPFTQKEKKAWESHYNEPLKVVPLFNEFEKKKEWALTPKK